MGYNALRDLDLAGVRWELSDTPLVRANAVKTAPSAPVVTPDTTGRTPTTCVVPPIAPVAPISSQTAQAMASRPTDTDSLNRMIAEFNHPLRSTATNVVGIHVAPNPNGLVIVTDMPGADDDASGKILSGAVGELMDKMLSAIGMNRDSVSIIPMLFWRTPGGRTPTRSDLDLSRPFVDKALELLAPRVILTLGTLPATELAGINLGRSHGITATMENGTSVVPIYHPNYLMLKPTAKRDVWNALQGIEKLLKIAE